MTTSPSIWTMTIQTLGAAPAPQLPSSLQQAVASANPVNIGLQDAEALPTGSAPATLQAPGPLRSLTSFGKKTAHTITRSSVHKGNDVSTLYVSPDVARDRGIAVHAFGDAMRTVLRTQFGGDVAAMTKSSGLHQSVVDTYLRGDLPFFFDDVITLESNFDVHHGTLADPWLNDKMALVDAVYPLPKDADASIDAQVHRPRRALARLTRRAILRTARTSSISTALRYGISYRTLILSFNADFPVRARQLKNLFDFIVNAGAATESEAQSAIGRFVTAVEQWEGRSVGRPYVDAEGNVFDHTYYDALNQETFDTDAD